MELSDGKVTVRVSFPERGDVFVKFVESSGESNGTSNRFIPRAGRRIRKGKGVMMPGKAVSRSFIPRSGKRIRKVKGAFTIPLQAEMFHSPSGETYS